MRNVYKQTPDGWILVFTAQSFDRACAVSRELEHKTGIIHCVNS